MLLSFFLMGQKGHRVLSSFLETFGVDYLECVVGSEDKNIQHDYYKEIKDLCKINNVPFYNRKDKYEISSDFSFSISWRWLIDVSKNTLIVFHDSLLPKYRGFAPLVNALINEERRVGVTALVASQFFDMGDIIQQKDIIIDYPIKIADAIDKISLIYCFLVNTISGKIIRGEKLHFSKQDYQSATYSLWLDEDDYAINWSCDAQFIKRFIDSVGFPYNGASCFVDNKKIRIFDAEVEEDVIIENRKAGKVLFNLNGFPSVVCGKGLLKITEAIDDHTRQSILPLRKFRSRFI